MIKQTLATSLTLLLLIVGSDTLRVQENTPLDSSTPTEGSQYCVDITEVRTVCTSDPIGIWQRVFSELTAFDMHLGVPQRIDGTESEQNSIKEVLRLMNLYWYEEVLSNYEYDNIRNAW